MSLGGTCDHRNAKNGVCPDCGATWRGAWVLPVGRPLKNPQEGRRKKIAVALPEALIEEVEQAAKEAGISRNEAVVRAVRAWVANG